MSAHEPSGHEADHPDIGAPVPGTAESLSPEAAVAPSDAAEPAPETPWRRQDPRMLAVLPIREIGRFLPAIIALLVAGTASDSGPPLIFGVLAAVAAVALGCLRWFTTTYRFTPDQIQLRTALIGSTTRTARIDRVRTVDLTASPLHRIVGLAAVKIGTGADESDFALDGLARRDADAVRETLLHRRFQAAAQKGAAETLSDADGADDAATEQVSPSAVLTSRSVQFLARFDPRWIRYAPFGLIGLAGAAAIVGIGFQAIDSLGFDPENNGTVRQLESWGERVGLVLVVVTVALVLLAGVIVLSIVGYVLQNWGFTLSRHLLGGTLHVSRGLLTTRATSLEEARLRGVRFVQPLNLRVVGGARLRAITTGLDDESSDLLLPESPAGVSAGVTDDLLNEPGLLTRPLRRHGPVATRRRWTRAFAAAAPFCIAAVVAAVVWSPVWAIWLPVLLVVSAALAADRARALGHEITEDYVITRSGSLNRSTEVLERRGIIGVNVSRSFFQRRAGVATVTLTSAAGDEEYTILDLPEGLVAPLVAQVLPGPTAALLA